MFEIIIHLEQVTVRKWREMGSQMFSKTFTSAALCPRPLLAYSIWALLSVWGPTVINPKYHYSISPEYGKHCDTVSLLAPGYPLHSDTFFGPKWHSPVGSMPFHRAQKVSISRAQPPPTRPRNGCCPHQKHYARGRIKHRCRKATVLQTPIIAIQWANKQNSNS